MKKMFSIVIPIYKNELNLPITIPYLLERIPTILSEYQVELILINDGSPDNSWEVMKEFQSKYPETIRIAKLIHNFGQGNAINCGIRLSRGDAVGVISADLQDPFELFVRMLDELKNGHDLVCGVRDGRTEKGLSVQLSKITHWSIKRFINAQYPAGGFDFFVMNRAVANRFLEVEEKNGSQQLSLLWLSSSTKFIPYFRREREIGTSGWTFSKKVKYFIDTFVSNSYLPLRLMSIGGVTFAALAFVFSAVVFVMAIFMERDVPGWSSLALLATFFSGLILMSLGIIGEYLWRIFDEVKRRPPYFVEQIIQRNREETEKMNSFYSRDELEKIGFAAIGDDVLVSRKVSIYGAEKMSLGNHVRIDDFCVLSGKITIGSYIHISVGSILHGDTVGIEIADFCGISGHVSLYAASDDYSGGYLTNPMVPERYKNTYKAKIRLEKHVLIGSACTILPGVIIGEGCSIGSMSLVQKELKPWTIYAGIPCRELKPRSKRLLELEAQFLKDEALREN